MARIAGSTLPELPTPLVPFARYANSAASALPSSRTFELIRRYPVRWLSRLEPPWGRAVLAPRPPVRESFAGRPPRKSRRKNLSRPQVLRSFLRKPWSLDRGFSVLRQSSGPRSGPSESYSLRRSRTGMARSRLEQIIVLDNPICPCGLQSPHSSTHCPRSCYLPSWIRT